MLFVTPSADGYGSDRVLIGVVRAMSQRFAATVVSAAEGPTLDVLRSLGAEVIVAPDFAMRRRYVTPRGIVPAGVRVLRTAVLLRRLHRQRRFVGVYVNTVANLVMPLLAAAVPAPIVVHAREVPRATAVQRALLVGSVQRIATRVLTNSTHTAEAFREMDERLAGRLVVVHDGVDDPGLVARRNAPPGAALEIVCVGRLHPQKGQHVLLAAVGAAVAEGADYRLHFWGDALAEHAAVEADLRASVSRLGLDGRVEWHGYSSDVSAMYAGMDVAVIPSTWPEGFSLVTAEAQAAGLPAIATIPGGPADIVVDGVTGRLVGLEDPDGLRAALAECTDPAVRERWGDAGRVRYLEHFTTERSANAVAASVAELFG
ncbi:MAG: glycosyltransferase family 4 protein [Actinobacteria bacterium]|nr:glycosyltransferase family 4 protein [Actinomycetota bacterium]